MSVYIDRLKERFKALVGEPWFENYAQTYDMMEDYAGDWREGPHSMHRALTEICKARGLPYAPGQCQECERVLPDDVPDRSSCPACVQEHETYVKQEKERARLSKERWNAMTPEQQAEEIRNNGYCLAGLVKRDVQ
jgi:hypothetical protein